MRQDAQALRRRTVKGDCRTCRFLAGHPKPEERPVPLGNAGFFQTLSKKKCARFQLPSYEIAVTIAHVRQRVKGFQEKGPVRGGLAGRARPGWPLIKKRTAGPTPTCMGPAVLYRRIRRRVRNPVYSPNNEACLINRHAMPLAGTQCLSRLQRTHGVFRAYGVPYKRKLQGICLPLHTGKALQKQANRFTKARKEEIHRSHTTSGKQQRKTQKDPALGIPGVGSLLFIREKPSLLFSISQWLPCSASRDV